jgi:photosynthetic reaction center cytochrome c subunit
MSERNAGWRRGLQVFVPLLLSAAAVSQAQGKFPPESLKNVQAMPEGTSVKQVVEAMRGFTRALGVRCTYCHVGTEGQPLEAMDFVADTKAAKKNARTMIRMTQAINDEQLPRLVERVEPHVAVTCATCHRGVTRPRALTDEVLGAYGKGGVDAAAARFRELRLRYYGRAAYDFGDVSLSEAANALHEQGDTAGALKLLELNVELLPDSWFGHWRLAEMRAAAGQTQGAIAALERAIALQSRPDLVERLEALKKQAAAEQASDKPRP